MSFNIYELGDLCEIRSSKRIYAKDYVEEGVPFYRSKEVIQKHNQVDISTELFITKEQFEIIKEKYGVPLEGDILLTSVGTLGIPYMVQHSDEFYFKDGNLTWFSNFNKELNNKFLYYWFTSSVGKYEIDRVTIGSTQKALTIVNLKKLRINLPPMYVQEAIVKILESLNLKLTNNLSTIQILEQLSQTLFKRWFIDFEFPNEQGLPYRSSDGRMVDSELGEIPADWSVGILEDYFDLKYGKALTKNDRISGDFPVYGSGGVTDSHKDFLVKGPGLIIGRKGSIGTLYYEQDNFYPIDTVFYVESKGYSLDYIYSMLKTFDFTKSNNDSAIPGLNRNLVYSTKAIYPSSDIIYQYERFVSSIRKQIFNLQKEISKLQQLRDSLLPKLLSGEVEIPEESVVE